MTGSVRPEPSVHAASALLSLLLAGCAGGDAFVPDAPCQLDAPTQYTTFGGWRQVPAIVIAAAPGDPRLPEVYEAIDYWNQVFTELGTPFAFGPATQVAPLADACVAFVSAHVLSQGGERDLPQEVRQLPGELVIALTDADLISFAFGNPAGGKVLVGIRSHRLYPLTLPNVTRNLVAHELGHALGLGHNTDPAMLMCGRPASCRPDAFQSQVPRFFPLTDGELATLLSLYPPNWVPAATQ
jgi:hypothetical protein